MGPRTSIVAWIPPPRSPVLEDAYWLFSPLGDAHCDLTHFSSPHLPDYLPLPPYPCPRLLSLAPSAGGAWRRMHWGPSLSRHRLSLQPLHLCAGGPRGPGSPQMAAAGRVLLAAGAGTVPPAAAHLLSQQHAVRPAVGHGQRAAPRWAPAWALPALRLHGGPRGPVPEAQVHL